MKGRSDQDIVAAINSYYIAIALASWILSHPKTVEGLLKDYENNQWKRIMKSLDVEDTLSNRELISNSLPKILKALQGLENNE